MEIYGRMRIAVKARIQPIIAEILGIFNLSINRPSGACRPNAIRLYTTASQKKSLEDSREKSIAAETKSMAAWEKP